MLRVQIVQQWYTMQEKLQHFQMVKSGCKYGSSISKDNELQQKETIKDMEKSGWAQAYW